MTGLSWVAGLGLLLGARRVMNKEFTHVMAVGTRPSASAELRKGLNTLKRELSSSKSGNSAALLIEQVKLEVWMM